MLNYNNEPHYYLIAQNRDGTLIIGITGESQQIIRTAHEIIADKTMLSGFSPKQTALIEWIAEDMLIVRNYRNLTKCYRIEK